MTKPMNKKLILTAALVLLTSCSAVEEHGTAPAAATVQTTEQTEPLPDMTYAETTAEIMTLPPDEAEETETEETESITEIVTEDTSYDGWEEIGDDPFAGETVDVDLTQLESNMVYGVVFDMVSYPDEYAGKTVKANGIFGYQKNEETGQEYFAIIIKDATACCSQGLEFVLDGDYTYPDDFPPLGSEITVSGEFEPYKEGFINYIHLVHARMKA